ncbi:MAG: sel1 repeat family protein [Gammaproteobacteria bacterium]|nr:sel1 repeat family protein [Gammaproteobacteria bacterium]
MPDIIHAQSQEGNPDSKGTLPKAVQDHNRWVMDQKSWGLPNATAVKVAKRTAAQGHAPAQFRLSLMYDRGWGVQQSDIKAVKWLRKAAEQDFAAAQYNLGSRYESGEGVTQDHVEAASWFRKAAEQGSVNAQKNLGVMYGTGQGVPGNYSEAYVWSSIAAESGDKGAIVNRNLAANKLSSDQLNIAQKRATDLSEEIQQRSLEYHQ